MLRADNRSYKTTQIQLSQVFSVPRNLLTYKLFKKTQLLLLYIPTMKAIFFKFFKITLV